jgi:hypothetical protein
MDRLQNSGGGESHSRCSVFRPDFGRCAGDRDYRIL